MTRIYKTKWNQLIDLDQIVSITPTDEKLPIRIEIYCKQMNIPIRKEFPIIHKKFEEFVYDDFINNVRSMTNDLVDAWVEYKENKHTL